MTTQTLLLVVNALVCGMSALRLLTYRRGHQRHHYFAGLLAYMLIVAFGAITILIITNVYGAVQPYETIVNIILCAAVFSARGNVMRIVRKD